MHEVIHCLDYKTKSVSVSSEMKWNENFERALCHASSRAFDANRTDNPVSNIITMTSTDDVIITEETDGLAEASLFELEIMDAHWNQSATKFFSCQH